MMKCIKTGLTLFVQDMNKHTRVDLFFDGQDVYVNHNKFIDGRPPIVEAECVSLEVDEKHDKLIEPRISKKIIEYIDTMYFKTRFEDAFVEKYKE